MIQTIFAYSDLTISGGAIKAVLLISSLIVFVLPLALIMLSQKDKPPLVERRTQL